MKTESMEKKLEIRKNKSKLAGTYIFIEDEKSYEERTIDWALRQIVREEIGKGKEVKRSYNSFKINRKIWNWDIQEEKLKEVKSSKKGVRKQVKKRKRNDKGWERTGRNGSLLNKQKSRSQKETKILDHSNNTNKYEKVEEKFLFRNLQQRQRILIIHIEF